MLPQLKLVEDYFQSFTKNFIPPPLISHPNDHKTQFYRELTSMHYQRFHFFGKFAGLVDKLLNLNY